MTVHIRNSYPHIKEEYLVQIEMHYRFSFPVEYKNFILSHNGGRPKQNVFRAPTGEMLMVDWFLGIHDDEHDNLLTYLRLYRDRIPSELLSIAHDAGGNLICIGVSGDPRGKLFFWDHEKETPEANASYDNVTYIAENFDEFLQMLKELEDLDKSGSH